MWFKSLRPLTLTANGRTDSNSDYSADLRVVQFNALCFLQGLPTAQGILKVSKSAKIRNRYNQAPHLTQDTNTLHSEILWYHFFAVSALAGPTVAQLGVFFSSDYL